MINGDGIFRADGINCLLTPGSLFTVNLAMAGIAFGGLRFIPQFAYMHLRTMTGTLTTSPTFRVGTNATHNNIAPAFTPPTTIVVGQIGAMPLTSPLIAPPITINDIILELTASAVGPSVLTADIILTGLLVG